MKKIFLIVISIMFVLLTACGTKQTNEKNEQEVNKPAASQSESQNESKNESGSGSESQNGILSDFSAADISGAAVDETVLSDYDLTMVNVWATFCSPCIREMPDLGELAAEYKEKGVQIAGLISDVLNSDGSVSQSQVSTAQEIIDKTKADYLHIIPSSDLFGLLNQISSVPTTFFVDKNGNQVGSAYLGSKSKSDWKSIIDETLKEVSE